MSIDAERQVANLGVLITAQRPTNTKRRSVSRITLTAVPNGRRYNHVENGTPLHLAQMLHGFDRHSTSNRKSDRLLAISQPR